MNFSVLGGDLRSVYLVRRLLRDGHSVQCFGLEQSELPKACHQSSPAEALWNTQCVVLPTPVLKGDALNAPLSGDTLDEQALSEVLPRSVPIFGGSVTESLRQSCVRRGIYVTDLLSIEALAVKNAALTAQCAVQVITSEIPYTIAEQPVLILGAGRIGKLLGLKLRALGAVVTVASRREEDKAWCAALGLIPADTDSLASMLPHCRLLVNTIPAQVLTAEQLELLPRDAVLFELASPPGGFRHRAAALNVVGCGGLPGKYVPQSAADVIADTIYNCLEM